MKQGKFNTSSEALQKRLSAHDKYAKKDLNQWIFLHLQPQSGDKILDLGCGTGKQSIPLAKFVGEKGHISAVDISEQSLAILRETASEASLEKRITTYSRNLDEFGYDFGSECCDRAVASFSLYYASNPHKVVKEIHRVLKRAGVFFFCGPASDNNRELKSFLSSLGGKISYDTTVVPNFVEKIGPKLVATLFKSVERFEFENPLLFDSADALYSYWSSHNLYEKSLDSQFKAAAKKHFEKNAGFTNIKRVLGIAAIK